MRGARVHLLALFLCGLVATTATNANGQSTRFRRADANADGLLDASDAVFTLVYLFLRGPAPLCFDAADANDDGGVDISDSVKALVHLFRGGEPPPPPGLSCGLDPTADTLSCVEYPGCEGGFTGSVIISEFMATNARTLRDGDGKYSDWIELANVGTSEVNLEGYYLTDDADEKTKWAFHSGADVTLAPGEFLVVIASGKPVADYVDRNGRLHTTFKLNRNGEYVALVLPDGETVISSHDFPRQFVDVSRGVLEDALVSRSLIRKGHDGTMLVGAAPIAGDWPAVDFDDDDWLPCDNAIGYETDENGLYTGLFRTDVESAMFGKSAALHLRFPFTVENPLALLSLTLWLRYDDGFEAYLNGVKVASTAPAPRPDAEAVGDFSEFDLSAHLGLIRPPGETNILAIQAFNDDVSSERFLIFGVLEATTRGVSQVYFSTPTPGKANGEGASAIVADTKFSVDRGFYEDPLEVAITTATPGATIKYTTDGSLPSESRGSVYTGPLLVDSGTLVLRAMAFRNGFISTNVDTQTYLYLRGPGGVLQQPSRPAGYPTTWAGPPDNYADYEMDPQIVNHPTYSQTIEADLKSIPTLSIVGDRDDLFGASRGIYTHPQSRGLAWERRVSMELFSADGAENVQEDSGIRVHGGAGRNPQHPKHSFRLIFRKTYGASKLRYDIFEDQLFGDSAAPSYDKLILRGGFNNTFPHWYDEQGLRSQYVRDQWARDLQMEMGHESARGRYVHLYLNGLYWGLYNITERQDEDYAASYFGGSDEDYDIHKNSEITAGSSAGWNQLRSRINAGVTSPEDFTTIQGLVDVENLIDYILINFYYGNPDWDRNNSVWLRRREPPGPYRFFIWDAEFAICLPPGSQPNQWAPILNINRVSVNNDGFPTGIFQRLRGSEDFRVLLSDRIHKHFFNDGLLTPDRLTETWLRRADQVDRAIVGESARWGDFRRDVFSRREPRSIFPLYTRDEHYLEHQGFILDEYFPVRTDIVLQQLRSARLYPDSKPPEFNRYGGEISRGFRLVMTARRGSLYYTVDGSDPRRIGGETSPLAILAGEAGSSVLLSADAPARVLVPQSDPGPDWRTRSDFDDSLWIAGANGVGFDQRTGYEEFIATDVEEAMFDKQGSVYIRMTFDVETLEDYDFLVLRMRYDDGFVAYLNGSRIASRNAPEPLAWNSVAARSHADSLAKVFEEIDVSEHRESLRVGRNLLALHGMNRRINNNDMLIAAELITRNAAVAEISLFESTRVRARILLDDTWSPSTDALFEVDDGLVISEIMYHPLGPRPEEGFEDQDSFEFLELANTGVEPIELKGYRFTSGIQLVFSEQNLAPGERLVIVADLDAFETRYGRVAETGIRVGGVYVGRLANGGEKIVLANRRGVEILNIRYDDDWHPATDGDGPSLVLADPDAADEALNRSSSWRASVQELGSPGTADE